MERALHKGAMAHVEHADEEAAVGRGEEAKI